MVVWQYTCVLVLFNAAGEDDKAAVLMNSLVAKLGGVRRQRWRTEIKSFQGFQIENTRYRHSLGTLAISRVFRRLMGLFL